MAFSRFIQSKEVPSSLHEGLLEEALVQILGLLNGLPPGRAGSLLSSHLPHHEIFERHGHLLLGILRENPSGVIQDLVSSSDQPLEITVEFFPEPS